MLSFLILASVVSFALGDGTSDISQHNPYTFSDVLTNDGPKSLRTESSGSGTLQVITYTSSSTCSGQAAGATFFAVGPCVPIGFQGTTSQSSTISVSGNTATITSYSDTACKTTTGSPVPLLLNSCQGANGVSLINYFYSAGGVPPAPYTTTSGQVTVTLQIYGSADTTCSNQVLYGVQSQNVAGSCPASTCTLSNANYVKSVCAAEAASVAPAFATGSSPSVSSTLSCFAGSETVTMKSGEKRAIADVSVGDKIAVAYMDGTFAGYSPVIFVPHEPNHEKATFTQISTVSGRDIKLTRDHLILGGACDALSLVQAGSLTSGQCVQTISGLEPVIAVTNVASEGIYTVVTKHDGLLIVNGIVVSPFAVNHLVTNAFYNIMRLVYSIAPSVTKTSMIGRVFCAFGDVFTSMLV